MNCQDIAQILDNRNLTRLTEAERNEVEVHLDGCAQCARDWRLHGEFAALPDLPMPDGFPLRCRELVASASRTGRARRVRGRFILIGTLAAMAVAAAMLVWSVRGGTDEPLRATLPEQAPLATLPVVEAAEPSPAEPPAKPQDPPASEVDAAPAPENPRFTVHAMPLVNEGRDAASTAGIAAFHAAVLDQLRALPGLVLVEVEPGQPAPNGPGIYALTISGGHQPDNSIGLMVGMTGPTSTMAFNPVAACTTVAAPGNPQCADVVKQAARAVTRMRIMVLPFDPGLQQETRARATDSQLDVASRFQAMYDLSSIDFQSSGSRSPGSASPLHEIAVIRAAIELAAVAPEPGQRAEIWRGMRGAAHAELVGPLIDAARTDPAREVRVEAMATLAADLISDPQARAALEDAAREDTSPLLRALAQRGLSGEGPWKVYVATSLRDASLPAAERVAALLHHVIQPGAMGGRAMYPAQWYADVLDDGAVAALMEVLPDAYGQSSPIHQNTLRQLASELAYRRRHPAVLDMLVQGIEGRAPWFSRSMAMQVAARHATEPGVRAALQKLAAQDADPALRDQARRALGERAATP